MNSFIPAADISPFGLFWINCFTICFPRADFAHWLSSSYCFLKYSISSSFGLMTLLLCDKGLHTLYFVVTCEENLANKDMIEFNSYRDFHSFFRNFLFRTLVVSCFRDFWISGFRVLCVPLSRRGTVACVVNKRLLTLAAFWKKSKEPKAPCKHKEKAFFQNKQETSFELLNTFQPTRYKYE